MKIRYIISLLLFFYYTHGYSQLRVRPEIGFSGTFSVFGKYNSSKTIPVKYEGKMESSNYEYVGFNAFIGCVFLLNNSSVLFDVQYQRFVSGLFTKNDIRKSDLLGMSISYRFLEKKRIKPFLQIRFLSEVKSNYINKSISDFGTSFSNLPIFYESIYKGHGQASKEIYEATLYQSTPFIGELLGGCAVGLIENMQLNFSIGYNLSILNYKYATFQYDDYVKEDYHALLKKSPMRHVLLHSLTVQLGLSYAFSLKKKPTSKK